jgi:hypothetical protein
MHGSEFTALGSYELRNPLASAFAFGLGGKSTPEHYQIEYRGAFLSGGVIKARVTRTRKGDTPAGTLLSSRDNESSVMMILTDDQNEIQVMETTKGAKARFYALTREQRAQCDPTNRGDQPA